MGRGEKRLLHAIKQAIDDYAPKAVFPLFDLRAGADRRRHGCGGQGGHRTLGHAGGPGGLPGFYGTKNLGNRIAGEAMFKHVIGTVSGPGARLGTAAGHPGA